MTPEGDVDVLSPKKCRRGSLSAWWHAYSRRPWETLQAAIMAFAGTVDLLGARPFPPEVDLFAHPLLWRVYGLYLAVGSYMVLVAIFHRTSVWARRLERTGMLLIAGAVTVSGMLYSYWVLFHQDTPEYRIAEPITRYLAILMFLTAFGAMARWHFLGRVPPIRDDRE